MKDCILVTLNLSLRISTIIHALKRCILLYCDTQQCSPQKMKNWKLKTFLIDVKLTLFKNRNFKYAAKGLSNRKWKKMVRGKIFHHFLPPSGWNLKKAPLIEHLRRKRNIPSGFYVSRISHLGWTVMNQWHNDYTSINYAIILLYYTIILYQYVHYTIIYYTINGREIREVFKKVGLLTCM